MLNSVLWAWSCLASFLLGCYLARKEIAEDVFGMTLTQFHNRFEEDNNDSSGP